LAAPLTHPLRVRYSECDQQGYVFNAHYLGWFDIAITELFRAAFGSYGTVLERGIDVVVGEARLQFRAPARFDDVVDLGISVVRLGETSLTCEYAITRGGELLVEGETRHVFVDTATYAKTPVPAWARAGLAPWSRDV
jgi:acyl-CoA thioester hydrolase